MVTGAGEATVVEWAQGMAEVNVDTQNERLKLNGSPM